MEWQNKESGMANSTNPGRSGWKGKDALVTRTACPVEPPGSSSPAFLLSNLFFHLSSSHSSSLLASLSYALPKGHRSMWQTGETLKS